MLQSWKTLEKLEKKASDSIFIGAKPLNAASSIYGDCSSNYTRTGLIGTFN